MQISFDDCLLDTDRRELRRDSRLVAIEPQVFDILVYLVENRDRVVSKDDLIASVWRGRVVSDSTLDSRINAVRKAVGDSGGEQRLVRTIARKGFRFIGEATNPVKPSNTQASSPSNAAPRGPLLHRLRWRPHRLRVGRTGAASGQSRQLAQPSRI